MSTPKVEFKKKPRKDSGGWWTDKDGSQVFIGKDYALQNEIDETRARTQARSCYRNCMSCGTCKASKRDNLHPQVETQPTGLKVVRGPQMSYDDNEGKWINCRDCEPFRFHDCHNGFMRDSRQEAEPFTQDQLDLIQLAVDKRPLM